MNRVFPQIYKPPTTTFNSTPQVAPAPLQPMQVNAPLFVTPPKFDAVKLRNAIAYNETRGEKNPYGFQQPSGMSALGNALGAYQVVADELKRKAPSFVGRPITPQQFLADPKIQDQYMEGKIRWLASKGFTPEDIAASHRGGFSDLSPAARAKRLKERADYVASAMSQYNSTSTPQ